MLLPTHLASGWLLGRYTNLSTWWLVLGAALPDVIDKTLSMLGVVELFHTIGHSAFLILLIPLVARDRRGVALAAGWASHIGLDVIHLVVNGRFGDLAFLGWPVITPVDPLALPPLEFLEYYVGSPSFYLEFVIWGFVIYAVITGHSPRRGSE